MRPSPPHMTCLTHGATRAAIRAAIRAATPALVTVALAIVAMPAFAQDRVNDRMTSPFITPFATVYGSVGTMLVDVDKLNTRLTRPDLVPGKDVVPGFDQISNDGYAIGVGGYTALGHLVVGGEFVYSDVGIESSPRGKTDRLETNYLTATVGYAALTRWRFTLFPYLGVGGGSLTLTLRNRDGGPSVAGGRDPSFDEIVLAPGTESVMKGSYVLLVPGIGFDYLILPSDTRHIGLTVGIRLASSISPNRTTWKYDGRDVVGAPDAGPTGRQLRLIFGAGGFRMKK